MLVPFTAAMSRSTWIDFSSEWFAKTILGQDVHAADAPFSGKQTQLLQELLKASFTKFAEELGQVLGTRLAELRRELTQLQDSQVDENEMFATRHGADATAIQQWATSHGKSGSRRTVQRRLRRKRTKDAAVYQRSLLLQLRPWSQISNVERMPSDNHVDFRLSTLEAVVFPIGQQTVSYNDHCEADSWQSGVAAQVLEKECRAVHFIQLWWRHRRDRRHARLNVMHPECNVTTSDCLVKQHNTIAADNMLDSEATRCEMTAILVKDGETFAARQVSRASMYYAVHGCTAAGVYETYSDAMRISRGTNALVKKFSDYNDALTFVANGIRRS